VKIYKISKRKSIMEIANLVRSSLVKKHCPAGEEQCLRALCLDASIILAKELRNNGFDARVVMGTFYLDNPDVLYDDDEHFMGEDEIEYEDGEHASHNPLHYWVEVDNMIVDITADQFNYEVDGYEIPEIVFNSYSENTRYEKLSYYK
jgi:hypothetical protein